MDQLAENTLAAQYTAIANAINATGDHRTTVQKQARAIAEALAVAEPFAWLDDPVAAIAAQAKAESPDTQLTPDLPEGCQACWCYFHPPCPIDVSDPAEPAKLGNVEIDRDGIHALLLVKGPAALMAVTYRRGFSPAPGGLTVVHAVPSIYFNLPYGKIGNMRGPVFAMAQLVVTMCRWLQERVVVTHAHPIERHRRKQLAREKKLDPLAVTAVRIVTLRRPEVKPHEPSGEPYIDTRTYRYVVPEREAWRACGPNHSERKRVMVHAHINGPRDKPLRMRKTIYEVKR